MRRRLLSPALFRRLGTWLLLAWLLAGCGALPTDVPEPEIEDTSHVSPVATAAEAVVQSILPTATTAATAEAVPTVAAPTATLIAAAPTAASTPSGWDRRAAMRLVVLHTNDNWGETEPCG